MFPPRHHYGVPLEPRDAILHGAGQSAEAFAEYTALTRSNGTPPALHMSYFGLRGMAAGTDPIPAGFRRLRQELDAYPDLALCPQIGLSMTTDGRPEEHYEHEVAAGQHAAALDRLVEGLRHLDRPVYLRLGYECNGPWNGYQPASYGDAFRRVTEHLRAAALPVATVWCVEGGHLDKHLPYYPGDEWVDWWSIDLFSPAHLEVCDPFFAQAEQHQRPVLIGESTPRRVGVEQGEASWNGWYARYFDLFRRQPGLKAFCYINWNWARYPQWSDWGNARIQDHPLVLERYLAELRDPIYLHGSR